MNQDPNKRPNGTYKPKAERLPPVNLDAAIHGGLRLLAFALFRQAIVEAIVDLHSALLLGGEVDASTVQFWRDQGGLQPKRPPKAMRSALMDLARWLGKYPDLKRVWAQGPSFDVAILEGYYRRAGLPIPWGYSMPRDTRTVYDLAKERGWSKPEGTQAVHTSLEDCRRQIICLMSALNVLRGNPEGEPKIG